MSQPSTARRAGYRSCEVCHLLVAVPEDDNQRLECPRCHATLHLRRPDSLNRTTALVIAGFILYVPANLYPVMTIELLGRPEPNTIFTEGCYCVAHCIV